MVTRDFHPVSTNRFLISAGDVSVSMERVNDWDNSLWRAKCELPWVQIDQRVRGDFDTVRVWADYVADNLAAIHANYEEALLGAREDVNNTTSAAHKLLGEV